MNCENEFCIYQHKDKCTLDNISINQLAMCSECIFPNIDEELLFKEKRKLLEKYD